MSEHDSHDDPALSALYRRMAQEEPPVHLDERVMAAARRHALRRSHRWWLPLSSAAVVVLAVSLLLRHQQAPDELQREMAQLAPSEAAAPPAASTSPAAPVPEMRRKEANDLAKPAPNAKSTLAPPAEAEKKRELPGVAEQKAESTEAMQALPAEVPLAESAGSAASPAEVAAAPAPAQAPANALAAAPAADMVESKKAETRQAGAAGAMARSRIADEQKQEATEAPEPWLKRIEALRAKGELEAAKRELTAFRKVYPGYTLPRELQALLPEAK